MYIDDSIVSINSCYVTSQQARPADQVSNQPHPITGIKCSAMDIIKQLALLLVVFFIILYTTPEY